MASAMLPPARPFRLNVHVLPSEAGYSMDVEPTRRFLQVTPRSKTLQQFCNDISLRHNRQYGIPLDIKKCQEASGADLDLEYRLSDIFEDHDIIRVIEAPSRDSTREDSLFAESTLRPKSQNTARFSTREDSLFPESTLRPKRARSTPNGEENHENGANKRQRVWDPDRPIRSLERDFDDEPPLINGDVSQLQVIDSQQQVVTAQDTRHTNGALNSTPRNTGDSISQDNLGSPFDSFNLGPSSAVGPTARARSGSEASSSFRHRSKSGGKRHRRNSLNTAATNPLDSVVPNTPAGRNSSRGSLFGRSVSNGQNSSEQHQRIDVYDDIEDTDTEGLQSKDVYEDKVKEHAQEKLRTAEKTELTRQRKLLEEDAARRQQEAMDAAEARRLSEELRAEKERVTQEENRIRLERQRQEEAHKEEEKRIQVEKEREAEQKEEQKRVKEAEKEKKRAERAAHAALRQAEKQAQAAKKAEKELQPHESTSESEPSKRSSKGSRTQHFKDVGPSGFPPCRTNGSIWNPERDDILMEARGRGEDWSEILKQHFPNVGVDTGALQRRYRTVCVHREKWKAMTGQNELPKSSSSTTMQPKATPQRSSSKPRRESSTAPIPSNGKVISTLPAAMSSQAVATSSPYPSSDIGLDGQIPSSPKTGRSVSFAKESTASGQQKAGRSSLFRKKPLTNPEMMKETPIPAPQPFFSSQSQLDGSSGRLLKQTRLVSPRLGITDVKATAKTVGKTPNKLTAKPGITPTKTYGPKSQTKLVRNASPQKENPSFVAKITSAQTARDAAKGHSVSQYEEGSTDSRSDDESSSASDASTDDQPAGVQETVDQKDDETASRQTSSAFSADKSKAVDGNLSQSREQSQGRDSRSPVAFMSQRANPTALRMESQDLEDPPEVPASYISSSPPVLARSKNADRRKGEDSPDSEEDDLDDMELNEVPTSAQLPAVIATPEQEMDEQLQSQIRRDSSSQRESQNSATVPPLPKNPHHQSYSLPSLVGMSRVQTGKISSGKEKSKPEPTKPVREETASEEESEEDSDESGSSSDNEEDDLVQKSRSAGTDLRKKKAALSFEKIRKQMSMNRK